MYSCFFFCYELVGLSLFFIFFIASPLLAPPENCRKRGYRLSEVCFSVMESQFLSRGMVSATLILRQNRTKFLFPEAEDLQGDRPRNPAYPPPSRLNE